MSKIMLVNVTHVEESRVAILENGVLEAYEIETINRANIKGNIYNAVVENVHPSLEAAFLRLTPDLKGFLPLDEVNFKLLPVRGERGKGGRIGQHLHAGQKILAQVVREPFSGKPPTVSTYFSLPGRYLVLMPGVDSDGVSRKIEDAEQRERLRKLIEELNAPEGFGVIVRTAGVSQSRTELARDLRYLLRLWESIKRASTTAEFPSLVYRERDLVIRTIRDYFTPDISEVWIDSPEIFERAMEFVQDVMPGKTKILHLYQGDRPLFSKFNLEDQIESIYKRRVPLPSGGEIIVDGTEALTAIDVNSARASRKGDAEDTILQTNLEAAAEIARQLRLRDLGGLLVVDFIDMASSRNQKKVEKAMRDAMKGDRAKYDVTRISKLGLMEIARQRIRGEKMSASYATCPACEGYGLIKNVEPAALSALRKLQVRCTRGDFARMRMAVPPEVASWILNNKREDLVQLERRHNIRINVEPKSALLRHESEFETYAGEKADAPPALVAPDRPTPPLPPDPSEMAGIADSVPAPASGGAPPSAFPAPAAAADAGVSGSRKRRRRRRRHRGDELPAGAAYAEEPSVEPADLEVPAGASADPFEEPLASESSEEWEAPLTPPLVSGEEEEEEEEEENAGEPDEAEAPAEPAISVAGEGAQGQDPAGSRRRRRRRRRRRGRGGAGPATAADSQPPADGAGADAPELRDGFGVEDEPYVPPGVRAEELMPAATGGRRHKDPNAPARPWRGRRRRGPAQG